MPETYQTALSYAPLAIYAIIGTILFLFRKFTFNTGITLLLTMIAAKVALSIIFGGILFFLAQMLIAVLAFVLLVMFFSGKTSGETMLTMTSLFALTPLMDGIPAFLGVFLLFFTYAFIMLRDRKEFNAIVANAVIASGMAQTLPDYGYLPERKELAEDKKRVSLLPFIAIVYTLFGLFYALRPLWMDA